MKWEYLTVDKTLDNQQMNELGDAGWELVAVVSPAHFVFHYFLQAKSSDAVETLIGLRRLRASSRSQTLHGVFMGALVERPAVHETVDTLLKAVAEGRLEVVIDRTFSLECGFQGLTGRDSDQSPDSVPI